MYHVRCGMYDVSEMLGWDGECRMVNGERDDPILFVMLRNEASMDLNIGPFRLLAVISQRTRYRFE